MARTAKKNHSAAIHSASEGHLADQISSTPSSLSRTSTPAVLTISSKNYSSWSLRAWLMLKFSGLTFTEHKVEVDAPGVRAELLLLAPSILVPCLNHHGIRVWDTLAIGEYLHEVAPKAGLLPTEMVQRAHCRAICGEMHSGFSAMRAALPMNFKAQLKSFKVWSKAQADIDRIIDIWTDCLKRYKGPYLFGAEPNLADAMFSPVASRFTTYNVTLPKDCAKYRDTIMGLPAIKEWSEQALLEQEEFEELDMDF